jgi:hypothetical protein
MQGEIAFKGVTYIWSVFNRLVTVTAPDGRQKMTQLGGSPPESIARLLAKELAVQRPKEPLPETSPGKSPVEIIWPHLDDEEN